MEHWCRILSDAERNLLPRLERHVTRLYANGAIGGGAGAVGTRSTRIVNDRATPSRLCQRASRNGDGSSWACIGAAGNEVSQLAVVVGATAISHERWYAPEAVRGRGRARCGWRHLWGRSMAAASISGFASRGARSRSRGVRILHPSMQRVLVTSRDIACSCGL